MSKRERVAALLDRAGANGLILRARARAQVPFLSILTYHSVDDLPSGYPFDAGVVDAGVAQFEAQLEVLARHFSSIGIDDLLAAVDGVSPLPPNPLLITFDDGYKTNLHTVAPALRRHGLTGAFFIATDFIDRRRLYWWDRINYNVKTSRRTRLELGYPRPLVLELRDRSAAIGALLAVVKTHHDLDLERFLVELAAAAGVAWDDAIERQFADALIMTWDEVRALRAVGMDVQSHTAGHRVLQTLPAAELDRELAGSKARLEAELGEPVRTLSYPVGRPIASAPHIRDAVAAAGYELGFSNSSGINYDWRRLDRYDVRRVSVDPGASHALFLAQLAVPPLAGAAAGRD
jgi:peptidoglycan/xylan/chitin deacetylase (PgdA/CDA1 family)